MNVTYFQVTGTLMATDDISNVNSGLKQFETAVGIHAAINPL